MPVYIHIFNLIIDKKAVIEKYTGGVQQFRIDYNIPQSEVNQEDDHLFSLGKMNIDDSDIDLLTSSGLSYDVEKQESNDFTIAYRYGGLLWHVDWLKENRVFAWHTDTPQDLISKVDRICNMKTDDIIKLVKEGKDPLNTIRYEAK